MCHPKSELGFVKWCTRENILQLFNILTRSELTDTLILWIPSIYNNKLPYSKWNDYALTCWVSLNPFCGFTLPFIGSGQALQIRSNFVVDIIFISGRHSQFFYDPPAPTSSKSEAYTGCWNQQFSQVPRVLFFRLYLEMLAFSSIFSAIFHVHGHMFAEVSVLRPKLRHLFSYTRTLPTSKILWPYKKHVKSKESGRIYKHYRASLKKWALDITQFKLPKQILKLTMHFSAIEWKRQNLAFNISRSKSSVKSYCEILFDGMIGDVIRVGCSYSDFNRKLP